MSLTTKPGAKRVPAPVPRRPARGWPSVALRLVGTALLCLLLLLGLSWARMLWVEDRSPRQAAPAQGRWLHAHDVELYVQEFGDPAAPPLVLTHGTGAWSGTWDQNVQAMAAAGYRVIAVDLPPFGFSTRPASRDYSRGAQARRITRLIDALKLGPVTLLGHSYGGGPAAEAAMLQPDRVRRLILVDAAIGLRESPAPAESGGVAAGLFGIRPLRTALIATVGTQPLFSEFWLRKFVARKEVVTHSRTAIYRRPFVLDGFTASLGDWAVQFAGESGKSLSERPEAFLKLSVPLTLVWGQEDSITPLSQAQTLQRLAPGATLVVLPGVGHIPQIEDPTLFNLRLAEVLKQP